MDERAKPSPPPSAWAPLRRPIFRALWIAGLASNVGTWAQSAASGFVVAEMSPSPLAVALLQTAAALPIFLLGVPAGAMSDVLDRRRLLIVAQLWMLACAIALAAAAFAGVLDIPLMMLLVALGAAGSAFAMPAALALLPEQVSREELPAAITLNGVSINLSRAAGPVLGGFLVAGLGPWAAFALNGVSFLALAAVLIAWRRAPVEAESEQAERILGAVRASIRYARNSPAVRVVLWRTGLFILGASALWALIPAVATRELGLNASGFGALLGCVGIGSLLGAVILPRLRHRFSPDMLLAAASVVFAGSTALLGLLRSPIGIGVGLVFGGVAWITAMSVLNVAAGAVAPAWARSRVFASYLMVSQGGMAVGGMAWGFAAQGLGSSTALAVAAVLAVVTTAAAARARIAPHHDQDLTPARAWPVPEMAHAPAPEDGPVRVVVSYEVDEGDMQAFVHAMTALREARLRTGAYAWRLDRDLADPHRFVETFSVESWAEHLRQHDRFSHQDRQIQERAQAFHRGSKPPAVTHLMDVGAHGYAKSRRSLATHTHADVSR